MSWGLIGMEWGEMKLGYRWQRPIFTEYETLGLILSKGKKQRLGRESRYEMWIRSRLHSASCLIFWDFFLFYKQDVKTQSAWLDECALGLEPMEVTAHHPWVKSSQFLILKSWRPISVNVMDACCSGPSSEKISFIYAAESWRFGIYLSVLP